MTLSELVDLVCTKVHRNDDESKAEARKYIRSRYQIIWDSRLWRDTLELRTLRGAQLVNEFGNPLTDASGNILTTGLIDQVITMPVMVSKIVACRWGDIGTLENEELSTIFFLDPSRFDQIGEPMSFSIISPSGLPVSPGSRPLIMASTSNDASFTVTVRGYLGDLDYSEVITVAGQAQIQSVNSYDNVVSLSKTSTEKDLIVRDDLGTILMTLPADETFRRHQRIHFHSTPREAGEMLILYKRRIKNLIEDSDSTEIDNIDNMLIAAAISDMREGERQYTKAAAKSAEVAGLMDFAIRAEREQSASNPRIIPAVYQDEYGWEEWSKEWM